MLLSLLDSIFPNAPSLSLLSSLYIAMHTAIFSVQYHAIIIINNFAYCAFEQDALMGAVSNMST